MTDVEIILNCANVQRSKWAPVDIIPDLNNGLRCITFQCPYWKAQSKSKRCTCEMWYHHIPKSLLFSSHNRRRVSFLGSPDQIPRKKSLTLEAPAELRTGRWLLRGCGQKRAGRARGNDAPPQCCPQVHVKENQTRAYTGSCTHLLDARSGWITVTRATIEDKTADQVNKHAETRMICASSFSRMVLQDNAIPTVFDLTRYLNNPQSRHRKQIKELSEGEIRTL